METASFSGFLKVLLYFFAFYYLIKFLARLFLPVLAKKVVEKASQQFQQQQQQQQNNTNQYGNTNNPITNATSDKPKEKKKVGDYVDFEEIE